MAEPESRLNKRDEMEEWKRERIYTLRALKPSKTNATSFCPDKIISVPDKIFFVPDKIIFVLDKTFFPRQKFLSQAKKFMFAGEKDKK